MSDSQITIRTAVKDDFDFVSQDGYLSEANLRRKINGGDVFVALRKGEQLGYLRLDYLWSKLPYIELIRVLAPHRRSGVGRALLSYVEQEVAARGHRVLYSSSQADEAAPQAWHRHMDFEECGFLSGVNAGGVGEVFFRKRLEAAR
ncbi:MAG: GNAT family N-acetyltransferase [Rhodothermales bacterium]|nr:GNAT family N-acetyltransferase [Rhodothermales bacterium]